MRDRSNAQLGDLRETAERRGWHIVHEYTDRGIIGAMGRDYGRRAGASIGLLGSLELVAVRSVASLTDECGCLGDAACVYGHLVRPWFPSGVPLMPLPTSPAEEAHDAQAGSEEG